MEDDPNAASRLSRHRASGVARERARPAGRRLDGRGPPRRPVDPPRTARSATSAESRTRRPGCRRSRDDRPNPASARSSGPVGADGAIGPPVEAPDVANRCAALPEVVPQSLRQQELVCLTRGHINCPRYLRGALVAARAPCAASGSRPALTPAIAARSRPSSSRSARRSRFVVAQRRPDAAVARSRPSASPAATAAAVGRRQPPPPATPRAVRPPPPAAAAVADAARLPSATRRHAGRDARADARSRRRPEAEADVEPVRPPHALPEHARLLDLHDPLGRQPLQHRQLLRRPARAGQGAEPLDADRAPRAGRELILPTPTR